MRCKNNEEQWSQMELLVIKKNPPSKCTRDGVFVRLCRSVKCCIKIASVPLKFQHLLLSSFGCSDIIPDLIGPNGARGAIVTAASSEGSPT